MHHHSILSILSGLTIISSALPSLPSVLELAHGSAPRTFSSSATPSPLDLFVPALLPITGHPSNLTTWPPAPFRLNVIGACFLNISVYDTPKELSVITDVLHRLLTIRMLLERGGGSTDPMPAQKVFSIQSLEVVVTAAEPHTVSRGISSLVLDIIWQLFSEWGAVELDRARIEVGAEVVSWISLRYLEPRQATSSRSLQSLPSPVRQANLTVWPAPPIYYYVTDTCSMNITAYSLPSLPVSLAEVLYNVLTIKHDIDGTGSPDNALPSSIAFRSEMIRVDFDTAEPFILRRGASRIIQAVSELLYRWGAVNLDNVDIRNLQGNLLGNLTLKVLDHGAFQPYLSSRALSTPLPISHHANLSAWPAVPFAVPISERWFMTIINNQMASQEAPLLSILFNIMTMKADLDLAGGPNDHLYSPLTLSADTVMVTLAIEYAQILHRSTASAILDAMWALEYRYGATQSTLVQINLADILIGYALVELFDPGNKNARTPLTKLPQ